MIRLYKKNRARLISVLLIPLLILMMFPAVITAEPATAKVIFTFDDGWIDTYTYAYPILHTAGYHGTVYVCRDIAIGTHPDMMRPDQIRALYAAGWDISNHTTNHRAYGDPSPDLPEATTDLNVMHDIYLENQDWILNNFGSRGAFHIAYPSGLYSDVLIDEVIKGIGAMTGRAAETEGNQQTPVVDPAHYYELPVHPLESDNNARIVAETSIDSAISDGSTVIFMIHRVMPDPGELVLTTSDFQYIIDYIGARSEQVEVMSMSEWYNNASVTAETPAAPAVTLNDTTNTVAGLAVGMEYNLNGTGYVSYDADTFDALDFSGNHYLLVRWASAGAVPSGLPAVLLFTPEPGAAKVIFTFHNGTAGQLDYALPILRTAGLKGTAYVSRDIIEWPLATVMSVGDLQTLYGEGWDIGNRPFDNSSVEGLSYEVILDLFSQNQDWLTTNGWVSGLKHAGYSGLYSEQLFTALKDLGMHTGVAVAESNEGINETPLETENDQYKLKVINLYNDHVYYINKAKTAIDDAVFGGYTVIFAIYDVQPGITGEGIVLSSEGLQEIVDYVSDYIDEGQINNVTISEWYEAQPQTIFYNNNTGSGTMPVSTANTGSSITLNSNTFIKTGYSFSGWNTAADGSGDAYVDGQPITMPSGGLMLYAQWSINQYTITFNSAGGSVVAPITQDFGTAIVAPADPVREGYAFAGWSPAVPTTMPAADTTLTAQWTINQYTITFDSAGGSAVAPITQDYGTAIVAPSDPVRESYTFTSWSPAVPTTMPAADATLTAQWAINQYTITFDSAGGSVVAPITQGFGTAIVAPADPVREGYAFAGWSPAVPTTMPAADATLTAQWTINQYTITFNSAGGSAVAPITQDYGTAITAPDNPSRTGYTFTEWSPAVPTTMPVDGATLTAQWNAVMQTITYNSNTGSGTMSDSTASTDSSITLSINTFAKTGYSFSGWNTSENGSGDTYVDGQTITIPAGGLLLYAQWTINQHTITFDSAGGSAIAPITQEYGKSITKPTDPTRMGYTFSDWYKDAGLTTAWNFSTDKVMTNITLYAKWAVNYYSVTFIDWDSRVLKTELVAYNQSATPPANPTRIGYAFSGWSLPFVNVTSNLEIMALYTDDKITSNSLNIDYADKLIGPLSEGTTINQLLQQLTNNVSQLIIKDQSGQTISDYSRAMATGMTIMIMNQPTSKLTIVIKGDLNGDGTISALDLLQMKKYLLGLIDLEGANLVAALVTGNTNPSALDLLQIKKHLLGQILIK